jgi:hypothetical protein
VAWSEELDPGETYSLLAWALHRSGQADKAKETVARGATRMPKPNSVAVKTLGLGRAVVEGRPIGEELAWFDERGYRRVVALWRALAG